MDRLRKTYTVSFSSADDCFHTACFESRDEKEAMQTATMFATIRGAKSFEFSRTGRPEKHVYLIDVSLAPIPEDFQPLCEQ